LAGLNQALGVFRMVDEIRCENIERGLGSDSICQSHRRFNPKIP
jgi:hypothetical protein